MTNKKNEGQKKVARPESMGRVNQKIVLEEIRFNGPISRADIARKTGLSKPSVSRAVDNLLRDKLVFEEDPLENHQEVGRKPTWLRFNTKAAFFQGVDIGGTKITFGLGDLSGELLEEHNVKNPRHWDKIVKLISNEVQQVLRNANIPLEKLKGIAVAAQGVVNIEKGEVTSAPNIEGPDRYPLRERIKEHLSVPVWIENDVNLAAMGEFWKKQGKYKDIVYISLGTVIGGAIIINGSLFRGKNYYAGEIGWFIPSKEYLFKDFGEFGCLESVASGPALNKKAKRMVGRFSKEGDLLISYKDLSPKHIFDAYKKGNALAKRIVNEWVTYLGITISNISSLLNPELVILDGGLTRSGGFFLNDLEKIVKWGTQKPPKIKISDFQEKVSLYGGIKLCLSHYMDSLFLKDRTAKD